MFFDQQYRDVVRVVKGCSFLLLSAIAAAGCSDSPSSAPVPGSPSTTTTTIRSASSHFSIEPCGGITTSSDLHPTIDNRNLLLTPADGPSSYTYGAARLAGGPSVVASVPSSSPAAYVPFHVPTSDGGWGGQEVIGEVSSPSSASQLARQVASNIASCGDGKQVSIPASAPGVTADTHLDTLSRSVGWVSDATVTVAEGPFIVSLQWTNSNSCSTYGGGPCPPPPTSPPPMPSASDMAALVNAALAKVG